MRNERDAPPVSRPSTGDVHRAADVEAFDGPRYDGRIEIVGDNYEIEWNDARAHVAASKGLADLATLIRRQGAEVPAAELMGSYVEQSGVDASVDAAAKEALERRLLDLQVDITEADGNNDLVRLELLQNEFDQVVDHLASAFGLGGRQRTSGGSGERARSAVTWRIRAAIRKIDAVLPSLGRHLRASIRTGTFCSYDPETPTAWDITSTTVDV